MDYFIQPPDFGGDCNNESVTRITNYYQIIYPCLPDKSRRFCLYCVPQTDSMVFVASFEHRLDQVMNLVTSGKATSGTMEHLPMLHELHENTQHGDHLEGAIAQLKHARDETIIWCAISVIPEGFYNPSISLQANLNGTRSLAQNILQRANELHFQLERLAAAKT